KRSLPVAWVAGGLAAVVLAAVVLAIGLSRRPAAPELAPAEREVPAPPVATPAEEKGGLLILATPWAEILEITDAAGYVHELPDDPSTPLYTELPEGLFRVTLAFAATSGSEAEERVCEVRIGIGEVATCSEIQGEPTATELFKEAGWWR
ncbi:MAG: hypothetical protein AAF725_19315, partial [Acidobacteriota bacterium]